MHVRDRRVAEVRVYTHDTVRWFELPVDVGEIEVLGDLSELVCGACEHLLQSNPGCQLAVRVRFHGASKLHTELAGSAAREHVTDMLASKMREVGPMWLEKVRIETTAKRAASLRPDMELPLRTLADIVASTHSEPALQKHLLKSLEELGRKVRAPLAKTEWPMWKETGQTEEFARLLTQAEQLLEAWVVEDESL